MKPVNWVIKAITGCTKNSIDGRLVYFCGVSLILISKGAIVTVMMQFNIMEQNTGECHQSWLNLTLQNLLAGTWGKGPDTLDQIVRSLSHRMIRKRI